MYLRFSTGSEAVLQAFVTILKKIGFTGGDVDPCLFSKKSKKGLCFIAIYVDDNLMIGHNAAIEDAIRLLKKGESGSQG